MSLNIIVELGVEVLVDKCLPVPQDLFKELFGASCLYMLFYHFALHLQRNDHLRKYALKFKLLH